MSLINQDVYLDLTANKGNWKSLIFMIAFRASAFFSKNTYRRIIGFPIRFIYKVLSEYVYHLEIKDTTQIGGGFTIWHGGHSTVINPYTLIGRNVKIRQNITIGSSSFQDNQHLCPIIGNNVEVGPNSVIIGKIRIGNNAIIGAGAVVVKDVPDYAVVAGNPARVLKIINS